MLKHLAIIMDGNGRWATQKGLPRLSGHREGANAVIRIINSADKLKIPYLSLYAFSIDNFKRGKDESMGIFSVISHFLQEFMLPLIKNHNYSVRFVGNLKLLPEDLLSVISKINSVGINNKGMVISIAIAYSGREEICNAFNKILQQRFLNLDAGPVTYDEVSSFLYTANIPDPDVIVRYGGYQRLSDFMPIQSSYSELFFLDKFFPDATEKDIYDIVEKYNKIKRNFGDVTK